MTPNTTTTPPPPVDLAAIEERLSKATPGPWVAPKDCAVIYAKALPQPHHLAYVNKDDAPFIAHARTDIPALLAEISRLRTELARVEGAQAWTRIDAGDPATWPPRSNEMPSLFERVIYGWHDRQFGWQTDARNRSSSFDMSAYHGRYWTQIPPMPDDSEPAPPSPVLGEAGAKMTKEEEAEETFRRR